MATLASIGMVLPLTLAAAPAHAATCDRFDHLSVSLNYAGTTDLNVQCGTVGVLGHFTPPGTGTYVSTAWIYHDHLARTATIKVTARADHTYF